MFLALRSTKSHYDTKSMRRMIKRQKKRYENIHKNRRKNVIDLANVREKAEKSIITKRGAAKPSFENNYIKSKIGAVSQGPTRTAITRPSKEPRRSKSIDTSKLYLEKLPPAFPRGKYGSKTDRPNKTSLKRIRLNHRLKENYQTVKKARSKQKVNGRLVGLKKLKTQSLEQRQKSKQKILDLMDKDFMDSSLSSVISKYSRSSHNTQEGSARRRKGGRAGQQNKIKLSDTSLLDLKKGYSAISERSESFQTKSKEDLFGGEGGGAGGSVGSKAKYIQNILIDLEFAQIDESMEEDFSENQSGQRSKMSFRQKSIK